MNALTKLNVDRLGTVASALCAVHCALTGLAFGLLSVIGLDFLGSTTAEIIFIGVTLTIGTYAVIHGIRKHHSVVPAAIFSAGLAGILFVHFGLGEHGHETLAGTVLSVSAGCCFILFHVVNHRLTQACACGECTH
ncbi:MAG: MerC domain-containing protein [Fimbriimonas sp.]